MKQKRTILLAAAAVVLLLIVLLIILLASGKSVPVDDPDSRYSYTVEENGKKAEITVSGGTEDGYQWVASATDGGEVLTVAEKSAGKKKTVFSLKSVSVGASDVTLSLEKETTPGLRDVLYELRLTFSVSPDGSLVFAGSSHKEVADGADLGMLGTHPCSYSPQSDGSVIFYLGGLNDDLWYSSSDDPAVVRTEIVDTCVEYMTYRFIPVNTGSCTVTLSPEEGNESIILRLNIAEDGTFTLTESKIK